jgi:uncharacterized protein YyaL (SSP411 family)
MTEEKIKQVLETCSQKLLDFRANRIKPGLDDKILTSWNSLMITAFTKGYRLTGEEKYFDAAKNCLLFIEHNLFEGNKLLRTYKNNTAKIDGYLEDYAFFVNSVLDVFEIDPDSKHLDLALKLGLYIIDHFWDPENKSFFMTSDIHEKLIVRPKSNYDLSLPSGNSISCSIMLRLYHLTQEEKFLKISIQIMESQAQVAAENPFGYGYLLNTIFSYLQKPIEITILNTENSKICSSLNKKFLPESIMVSILKKTQLDALSKFPFFAGKVFGDKTTVFVCRDFTCSLPLESMDQIDPLV